MSENNLKYHGRSWDPCDHAPVASVPADMPITNLLEGHDLDLTPHNYI